MPEYMLDTDTVSTPSVAKDRSPRACSHTARRSELEDHGLGSSGAYSPLRLHPEAGTILRGSVRRHLLRRFPYALLYKIKPSGIRILAVNLKRRSTYRLGRE